MADVPSATDGPGGRGGTGAPADGSPGLTPAVAGPPRNAVVVLLDSLNRHMVGAYGGREFDTPNIDRLAARSVRFTNHYAGSLPCIPARHDILCGTLDFLWRPWGSVEVWEEALPALLRSHGVVTQLVTDHPHLFEAGGENYHTDFSAWEYERGHEDDPWRLVPDPSAVGAPALPEAVPSPLVRHYDTARTYVRCEADLPGPRTLAFAARWLATEARAHDRFLLFVDEFDPHEPFDTPEPWASRYDPDWKGPRLIWPPYSTDTYQRGILTERQGRHLRANYGAKLSMIDHWLGKLLDAMDAQDLWQDTALVLCTDHGHYLGERDAFGKPGLPVFQTLGHLPLLVAWPGVPPREEVALTTSVDLYATLADLFGVVPSGPTHGRSLVPVVTGDRRGARQHVLFGVWGHEVQVTDGTLKYMAAPPGANAPLAIWSNRWSTMPVHALPGLGLPRPDRRARLAAMPGTDVPVIRQPFQPGDLLPYWAATRMGGSHLYRLDVDPGETEDRSGTLLERQARELLHHALTEVSAPAEQYERLGLGTG